ncbi:unnamed protein product [Parajaminaea phylloscopi]
MPPAAKQFQSLQGTPTHSSTPRSIGRTDFQSHTFTTSPRGSSSASHSTRLDRPLGESSREFSQSRSRREDTQKAGHHRQEQPAVATLDMQAHNQRIPSPSRIRLPKHAPRRRDGIRPERKASVRKESYDFGEDEGQAVDAAEDDDSELSDAPPSSDGDGDTISDMASTHGTALDNSDSDTEMAVKLQAAGDGESLLGSGDSEDEQEGSEERFIIADAVHAKKRAAARAKGDAQLHIRRQEVLQGRKQARLQASSANGVVDSDVFDAASPATEDIGSLSPDTLRLIGLPVLDDELFTEQAGFHSDSEPSFSDFFASDNEGGNGMAPDDGDELTSLSSDLDDSDDDTDISDLEGSLMGEPFLAHVGSLDGQPQSAEQLHAAMEAGAEIARQDIPLLVIEDLDGRLIYARAGDGEAVFGSDGEFEFVDDSDTDSDVDVADVNDAQSHHSRWSAPLWAGSNNSELVHGDDGEVFDDEGDTTDELPDEDMPFPRLLVGSVDPRGGRTSRRARAMAAHLRRLSPNGGKHGGHSRQNSNTEEDQGVPFVPSPPTPSTDHELTLKPDIPDSFESQRTGAGQGGSGSAQTPASAVLSTPLSSGKASERRHSETSSRPPEMGSFIPSSSKSVHRAVIDGSKPAASPFTSKYSLQRKGLAGKRRSRRSSLTASVATTKRARFDSPASAMAPLDDVSEAPSSPEALGVTTSLPMDLDDVVDGSLLWRSGDSSDTAGEDQDSDAASESTAGPSSRTSRGISDSIGLNVNAFSRWRKIPMGAFRDQQQQGARAMGHRIEPSRGARGAERPQPVFGNFLLQRVSNNAQHDKRSDRSPFRRTGSNGGSLHMVGPSPHATHLDRRAESFIVSPVLWPVRGSGGGRASLVDSYVTPLANVPVGTLDGTSDGMLVAGSSSNGKMTKREKRERKAKRAAMRAAARAEKERLRNEEIATSIANEIGLAVPRTPRVGGGQGGSPNSVATVESTQLMSPTTALPRLSITEASPRASPAPLAVPKGPSNLQHEAFHSSSNDGEQTSHGAQQSHPSLQPNATGKLESHSPSQLPGNTPPTRAVAGNGHVPSLPSSTFGPPLTSPLFGGLFAPLELNGHGDDDGEFDGSSEAPALQI